MRSAVAAQASQAFRAKTPAPPLQTEATMPNQRPVLTLADIGFNAPAELLGRYRLRLQKVEDGEPIPGSFWGECEAGIIGNTVHARADTPVHSRLHEAGHLIVLPPERR
mgnify:CR=1 FL=1